MFNNNYPYRSSMSKTMTNSFKKLSLEIIKRFNPSNVLIHDAARPNFSLKLFNSIIKN